MPSKKSQKPPPLRATTGVTTFAGLDTASDRWHLYCTNGFYTHCRARSKDVDERRHMLFNAARDAFSLLPTGTLLMCEEPLSLQNGKTTRVLGMAAGALWAAHLSCSFFWGWADVAQWKKDVIGNGNADKDKIEAWVRENMGLVFPDGEPDYYDAAAICRWGQVKLGAAHPDH